MQACHELETCQFAAASRLSSFIAVRFCKIKKVSPLDDFFLPVLDLHRKYCIPSPNSLLLSVDEQLSHHNHPHKCIKSQKGLRSTSIQRILTIKHPNGTKSGRQVGDPTIGHSTQNLVVEVQICNLKIRVLSTDQVW